MARALDLATRGRVLEAQRFGVEALRALGIDPDTVRSFEMRFRVNEYPTMAVEFLMPENGAERIAGTLAKFDLVPKE